MSSSNTSSLRNQSEDKPERNDFICYNCNEIPQIKIKEYEDEDEDENQIEITCHCFPFPTMTQTKTIKFEDILKELKKPYEKKNFCGLCSSSEEAKYYDTENEIFLCENCLINQNLPFIPNSIFPSEHLIIKNKCQNNSCKRKENNFFYCLKCNKTLCSSCITEHDLEAHETVKIKEVMKETEFKEFKEKIAIVSQKMLSDNKKYEGIISDLEKNLKEAKSFYEKWKKENESILCLLNSMLGTYENYFQNKFENFNSVNNLVENDPREIYNYRQQVFQKELIEKLKMDEYLFSVEFQMKENFKIKKTLTMPERFRQNYHEIRLTYVEARKEKDIIAGDDLGRIFKIKYNSESNEYTYEEPIAVIETENAKPYYMLYKKDLNFLFIYNSFQIVFFDLINDCKIWTYKVRMDPQADLAMERQEKEKQILGFSVLKNGNLAFLNKIKGINFLGEDLETLKSFKATASNTFLNFIEVQDENIVVLGKHNIYLYEKNNDTNEYKISKTLRCSNSYYENENSTIEFNMTYSEKEKQLFVCGSNYLDVIDVEDFTLFNYFQFPSISTFNLENSSQLLIKLDNDNFNYRDSKIALDSSTDRQFIPFKNLNYALLDLKTMEWKFFETEGVPKWTNYSAYDGKCSLLCEGNEVAIWKNY